MHRRRVRQIDPCREGGRGIRTAQQRLVFESESFENFDNSWKARETDDLISNDEHVETFELAPPGKPFEVYSRNRFRRVGSKAN